LAVQTNFVVFYLETAAMKKIMGYDKGKLSREQIIEAGAGVVLAKGYAATTMANLSGAAHTSAGKLTHQFYELREPSLTRLRGTDSESGRWHTAIHYGARSWTPPGDGLGRRQ
jgi:hypothetical protein